MRNLIRQILKEETDEKSFVLATKFFNSLNLIPYHDKIFKMEYLGTKKGSFIIMTNKKTIVIQRNIYDLLLRILGKEKYVKSFIWDKLKDLGFSIPPAEFMYLEPDDKVGSVEIGDEPGLLKNPKKLTEAKMLPKNKFAKVWLSKFNDLKKYKSEDDRFIYLVDDNKNIIVSLDQQRNDTSVSYQKIWSFLERYFTEKETRRKIIGWLLDNYHLSNMGYVHKQNQDRLGKINDSDVLIESKRITESEKKDDLKNFFFKRWSKQKEEGKLPSLMDIKRLRLDKHKNEIISYYSDFMNLNPEDKNSRSELVKNYLLNNVFSEKTITDISDFLEQGDIKIRFSEVNFAEDIEGCIEVFVTFIILDGSFINEDGVRVNFSSENIPFDDMIEYFEFKDYIKEIIQNFIGKTVEEFGFDLDKDVCYIDVEQR